MSRRRRDLWLVCCRLLPGVLTAQSFRAHTPRELEDMIAGAIMRHAIDRDLLIEHALRVGQWTRSMSFHELAGRDPIPLDPRVQEEAERDPLAIEREERARLMVAEAQMRAGAPQKVAP